MLVSHNINPICRQTKPFHHKKTASFCRRANYLRVQIRSFVLRGFMWIWSAVFAIIVVGGFIGCSRTSKPGQSALSEESQQETNAIQVHRAPPGMQASPLESTNILRSFAARGVIRDIPAGGRSLIVRHEEIPGFMPKMTMEFELRETNELRGLTVGDTIVFNIRATQEDSWIEGIRRAGTNDVIDASPRDPSSTALLHVATLKAGDKMPDAELLGEDGRPVRFSDFAGKAVAFTFIFTRCPLPNYCPRMSVNFSKARDLLIQNVDGPENWQFLSISFDPEFDKPGVLSRYAFSYRGAITNQWLFVSAPTNVLAVMSPQLDFRFANERGSFQHNLRTVVLNTKGRVHRYFEGNQWTAEDLATSISEAALQKQ